MAWGVSSPTPMHVRRDVGWDVERRWWPEIIMSMVRLRVVVNGRTDSRRPSAVALHCIAGRTVWWVTNWLVVYNSGTVEVVSTVIWGRGGFVVGCGVDDDDQWSGFLSVAFPTFSRPSVKTCSWRIFEEKVLGLGKLRDER